MPAATTRPASPPRRPPARSCPSRAVTGAQTETRRVRPAVIAPGPLAGAHRETRFPDAAHSREGDQPGANQQILHLGQLGASTHKGGQFGRQTSKVLPATPTA